jgi:hypothetical protein
MRHEFPTCSNEDTLATMVEDFVYQGLREDKPAAGPGSETIAAITRSGRNFFHVPSHVPSHPQTAAKARGFFVYSLGVHR